MSRKPEKCPAWATKAAQGLAFWMGHRRALYWGYPLSEGALVAETCNLISANLSSDETLLCEVQYSRLVGNNQPTACLSPKSRADLVVVTGVTKAQAKKLKSLPFFATVIEAKRASAGNEEIDKDLKRLAALKAANSGVRALLFLVAEGRRPARFVSREGLGIRTEHRIGTASHCKVRRVLKAASAFGGKEKSYYACIIEVLNGAAKSQR
jgi:hypothetical protein